MAYLSDDGKTGQQLSLSASEALSTSQLALTDAAVAVLSASGSSVCTAELVEGASQLVCRSLTSLLPNGASTEGAALVPGKCASQAALQLSSGAAVLALGSSGAQLVKYASGAAASGCFLSEGAQHVALATPSAAGLEVQAVSAADGSAVQPAAVVAGLAPQRVGGAPVPVAALFAVGGEQQLVVFDDDSLALVKGGRQAWLRHEELASIKGAHRVGLSGVCWTGWRSEQGACWYLEGWPKAGCTAALAPMGQRHMCRSGWAGRPPSRLLRLLTAHRLTALPPPPPPAPADADVLFTDLPAPTPENEAAWAASQPGWREALGAQVLQLQVQASQLTALPQLAMPEERQRLEAYNALTNDKLRPTRDADGFRKQVSWGGRVGCSRNAG